MTSTLKLKWPDPSWQCWFVKTFEEVSRVCFWRKRENLMADIRSEVWGRMKVWVLKLKQSLSTEGLWRCRRSTIWGGRSSDWVVTHGSSFRFVFDLFRKWEQVKAESHSKPIQNKVVLPRHNYIMVCLQILPSEHSQGSQICRKPAFLAQNKLLLCNCSNPMRYICKKVQICKTYFVFTKVLSSLTLTQSLWCQGVKLVVRTSTLTAARPGWATSNEVSGSSPPTSVSGCITSFLYFICMQDRPYFTAQHVEADNAKTMWLVSGVFHSGDDSSGWQ